MYKLEEKRKQLEYYKERMVEKKVKEIEDKKSKLQERLESVTCG